jgi:hypothetical protein
MRELRDGRVEVFTFKEGLLSKVAHDLCLACPGVRVRTDGVEVEAELELATLGVLGAMRDGKLDPDVLSPKDKAEIEGNVRNKILITEHYPQASFRGRAISEGTRHEVLGQLTLTGKAVAVSLVVNEEGGRYRGELELVPSRWGIAPFKAMLGAIRVADRVLVRFDFERGE